MYVYYYVHLGYIINTLISYGICYEVYMMTEDQDIVSVLTANCCNNFNCRPEQKTVIIQKVYKQLLKYYTHTQ